ncbi:hypothetical protein [Streptomyces sp. NPDC006368]|uniref:hypothetical protein n=1 Tax=Streptomyces sp. NPDC006368 TaxID=3156760 RepID=UPI0033A6A426
MLQLRLLRGALPSAEPAATDDVGDVPPDTLRAGQLLWATVVSPWVHMVDRETFLSTLEPLRVMTPERILSTHPPPAGGRSPEFLETLASAPAADPFAGPDQRGLEEMLAGFEPPGEPAAGMPDGTARPTVEPTVT